MKAGDQIGHLTVLEVLTSTEAGAWRDGQWVRCRCVCGARVKKRSRNLRWSVKCGWTPSCGCVCAPFVRRALATRAAMRGVG